MDIVVKSMSKQITQQEKKDRKNLSKKFDIRKGRSITHYYVGEEKDLPKEGFIFWFSEPKGKTLYNLIFKKGIREIIHSRFVYNYVYISTDCGFPTTSLKARYVGVINKKEWVNYVYRFAHYKRTKS